jgi:hypothetical protein
MSNLLVMALIFNTIGTPLGDASYLCNLRSKAVIGVPVVSRLAHLEERIKRQTITNRRRLQRRCRPFEREFGVTISSMS